MFSPASCIFLSILSAGLCVPGQSSYKSIFMVYIERRVGASCSVYDMLQTDANGFQYVLNISIRNNVPVLHLWKMY